MDRVHLNRYTELSEANAHPHGHQTVLHPVLGISYREIVRQQFTFSPPGTTREAEDYGVVLNGVTALELRLVPDISGGSAYARSSNCA